ncbi:hypothetical protein MNV49_000811 [Pseudohyphozyma bogoriensis]|nr:hypothetical protein MNV49_000811 [Pseudohyphozyma bogoriensis]
MDDDEALERSPFLLNLKTRGRLAPVRLQELLAAAKARKAPKPPEPGECCGSSCKPCVTELWKQELRCWKECHPDGEEEEEDDDEDDEEVRREEEQRAERKQQAKELEERRASPKVTIEVDLAGMSLKEKKLDKKVDW